MSFLADRGLPLGAKGRIYSACGCSIFYESQVWPVKEEDMVKLERNAAKMVRWIINVGSENRISEEELRTRLKLKSIKECLQDRSLQ